jgi:hypothetical protein
MARQAASVTTKPLWRPSISQLETIAQLSIARAPMELIARAVGKSPRAFRACRQARLKTAAAVEASKPVPSGGGGTEAGKIRRGPLGHSF